MNESITRNESFAMGTITFKEYDSLFFNDVRLQVRRDRLNTATLHISSKSLHFLWHFLSNGKSKPLI